MGWLEFIAAVISSISWPLAIVVVVLLLRHQIRNLIPLLRRIRYGEFEAEFSEEVVEAAEEIEQRVEATPVEELPAMPDDVKEELRFRTEGLRTTLQINPDHAVIEGWRLLESEAHRAAIRNDVDRDRGMPGVTRILRTLADRERVPEWVVGAASELRRLQAEAVIQGAIPRSAAVRYVNSIVRVADILARA
jgi:hypothetical protein